MPPGQPKHNTWRLYRPKEIVRAQKRDDGFWDVWDGRRTLVLEDGVFKKNYELAAQSQQLNKATGDYEYH